MSEEDDYVIAEEEILHNTSVASISKTNISLQKENDRDEDEISKCLLAKYSELDTTNLLYNAKQKEIVDLKIKLLFDYAKTLKEVDEINADQNRLKKISEELDVEKNEAIHIVSQQNVILNCVEKQLDTKSLIFEHIIPSKIEKQSLLINTLSSECDSIKKASLEKLKTIPNLKELKIKFIKQNRQLKSEVTVLEGDGYNAQYREVLLCHQQKIADQQAQKETPRYANYAEVDVIRKLMNENINLNKIMSAEVNLNEEILSVNIKQQERFNIMNDTLMEKKANYLNTQYCLLPTVQNKRLNCNATTRSYSTDKEISTKRLDHLNRDLIAQSIDVEKLQVVTSHLDFHYSREKENLNCNILKLDNSIHALDPKKEQLKKAKENADLTLKNYTEDAERCTNLLNNLRAQTNDTNKNVEKLIKQNNSSKDSFVELQNTLNTLSIPYRNDIEESQEQINILYNDIDNIKLEIIANQKLYAFELEKVEGIFLVTEERKLKRLRKQKKHIIDNENKKIEMRDSLTGRVTRVELAIQELLASSSKKSDHVQRGKMNLRCPKEDMGILKKIGEKSPGKRVHFEASLASSKSSQRTEDYSPSQGPDLFEKLFQSHNKIGIEASDSPPTRLYAKKGKYSN